MSEKTLLTFFLVVCLSTVAEATPIAYQATNPSLYILYGEGSPGAYSYGSNNGSIDLVIEQTSLDFFAYTLLAVFEQITINIAGDIPAFRYDQLTGDWGTPIGGGTIDFGNLLTTAYYVNRNDGVRAGILDFNFYALLPNIGVTQVYLSGEMQQIAQTPESSTLILTLLVLLFGTMAHLERGEGRGKER